MNVNLATSQPPTITQPRSTETDNRVALFLQEIEQTLNTIPTRAKTVVQRILGEVDRVCEKSQRIQNSGEIRDWQLSLARHRLQKCLKYYRLGSQRGRVELHSTLSAMVYRHIAPSHAQLGFQGRYTAIEDFMQGFYIESLRAFRRENELPVDYQPRTRIELAEYLAFTEQYAKRRISLPSCRNQQLVVLRAQGFARRLPPEVSIDIETAIESAKTEEAEAQVRSSAAHQVREQMVADAVDPAESVLRDRVVTELVAYLESQNQDACVDYLTLKLQDLSAPEIDEILQLTPRQRDYLQQRFKYHVERFSRIHNWELVHQWLGADLEQNLGMPPQQWQAFWDSLDAPSQELLGRKQAGEEDGAIAKAIGCTPKQLQKRWFQLLTAAWETRNTADTTGPTPAAKAAPATQATTPTTGKRDRHANHTKAQSA